MDKILDIVNGWLTSAVSSGALQIKQILLFIFYCRAFGSGYLENTRGCRIF